MKLNPGVFDVWVFSRTPAGVAYLLLQTSAEKAARYFNGGSFWQIPSGVFEAEETVTRAIDRELARYGFAATGIWAAEHAYTIYNRRFHEVQIITVYAAEVAAKAPPSLDPSEHGAARWMSYEDALEHVHFRGLKDGLRSVREYVTGTASPAAELRLRPAANTG